MGYIRKKTKIKKLKVKEMLKLAIAKFEAAKERMEEELTMENILAYNRASCDVAIYKSRLKNKTSKHKEYMESHSIPNHISI